MVTDNWYRYTTTMNEAQSQRHNTATTLPLWNAPVARTSLDATVTVPGSKSLSNRYLILAAMGSRTVELVGLLRSRDTDLMIGALRALGVQVQEDAQDPTHVWVTAPANGVLQGDITIDCGLAGTVMRFVPALAMRASGPVTFDGDAQAYARPMKPLLDGLEQLGATITYLGEPGFLPFMLTPPQQSDDTHGVSHNAQSTTPQVSIDASGSSQFISGLLFAGAHRGLQLTHTGAHTPSLPHIRMTMADLESAHIHVDMQNNTWHVTAGQVQLPERVVVEPDLSNAAPFIGAALLAGGRVRIAHWPEHTTQPGGLLPEYIRAMGAQVTWQADAQNPATGTLHVRGFGVHDMNHALHGLGDFDIAAAGEIAPSLAAILVFADSPTTLHGIAHLRGHETNRLQALVEQITAIGGRAEEIADGIRITPVLLNAMHGTIMQSYADHRMATFGAMIGLVLEGTQVENIATTSKTMPQFVQLWQNMLQGDWVTATAQSPWYEDIRLAMRLVDAADAITTERFAALDLHVEDKPDHTPVSDADRATERALRDILAQERPQDSIYGEELGKQASHGRRWIIDPIDGTKNYVRALDVWATLIGLQVDDEIVLGMVSAPMLHTRWFAVRGGGAYMIREGQAPQRIHVSQVGTLDHASLSLSSLSGWKERGNRDRVIALTDQVWRLRGFGDFWQYMLLAQGAIDICAEPELDLYDMAALVPIVEEAGGVFTDLDGNPGPWGGNALATNAQLYQTVFPWFH